MKISEKTIEILKSFSSINDRIKIKPGNTIRVLSPNKTSMATAIVEETFEQEFALHNVSSFLTLLGFYQNPEINFYDNYLEVVGENGKNTSRLVYCPSKLVQYPTADIVFPSVEVKFDLTKEELAKIGKLSGILNIKDFVIHTENNKVNMHVMDSTVDISNQIHIKTLEEDDSRDFNIIFRTEYLNLFPSEYSVEVNQRPFAKFTSKDINLNYVIAGEPTSTYSE